MKGKFEVLEELKQIKKRFRNKSRNNRKPTHERNISWRKRKIGKKSRICDKIKEIKK